jgi:hypothetical protein
VPESRGVSNPMDRTGVVAIFPFVNNLTLRLLPTCYERNRRLLAHGNSLSFG